MTIQDIKKALMTCSVDSCKDCPYDNTGLYCCGKLKRDALALITEQEKEIDFQVQDRARLQREIDELEQAHEQRVEEIERLRTTLGQCSTELNSALESLKSQCREIGELKAKIKQAQIDVLKELKTRHDYAIKYMGYPWDISQQIDELIAEVKNEN